MEGKVIVKKALSEQIREQIMEGILLGKYKPGERLVESALAKEYGVSQAPVREALTGLEFIGFVSYEPYKGTTVNAVGRHSVDDYVEVRANLESLAGRHAAQNITEEQIAELEGLLEEMVRAAEAGDYETRTEINQKFHNTIIRASENQVLINLCTSLRMGNWSKITSRYTYLDPRDMAARHQKIIDSLRSGDADRVEEVVRQHISESFAFIKETVEGE